MRYEKSQISLEELFSESANKMFDNFFNQAGEVFGEHNYIFECNV